VACVCLVLLLGIGWARWTRLGKQILEIDGCWWVRDLGATSATDKWVDGGMEGRHDSKLEARWQIISVGDEMSFTGESSELFHDSDAGFIFTIQTSLITKVQGLVITIFSFHQFPYCPYWARLVPGRLVFAIKV
jgi:hypothetical protein